MTQPTDAGASLPPMDEYRAALQATPPPTPSKPYVVTLRAHLVDLRDTADDLDVMCEALHRDAQWYPELAPVEALAREAWAKLQEATTVVRNMRREPTRIIACEDCDDTGRVMVANGTVVRCSCPLGQDNPESFQLTPRRNQIDDEIA